MNIMFMFDYPIIASNGGVQRVTDVLASEFMRRGYKVSYLCTSPQNNQDIEPSVKCSPIQYYLKIGIDTIQQIRELTDKADVRLVINQSFSNEAVSLLSAFPDTTYKVSVFHSQPFATYKKERSILRCLTTPHSLFGYVFKYAGIIAPFLVRDYYIRNAKKTFIDLINVSDKFCLLSDSSILRLRHFIPNAPVSKLIAINNPNTFIKKKTNQRDREDIILFVGRIENTSKNLFDFIRVWKCLMKKNPNWRAIVVGDGVDLQQTKSYANRLRVERIFFEGHQNDVGKYFSKAKFICCTSNYEGWPMVLIEAMQFGCIPISYNTFEAVYDIIDDGINGFIVNKKILSMAKRIQQCIDGEYNLNNLSEQAQQKVNKFSVDIIVNQWEKIINQNIISKR